MKNKGNSEHIETMREINKHGKNGSNKRVGFPRSSRTANFFGTFNPVIFPDYDHIIEKSLEFERIKYKGE